MGLTAAIFGGVSGTAIHTIANSVKKVPLSRQPYLHVFYFMFGAWAGNGWMNAEKQLVQDINEIRADKGMPPLVGSSGTWIRYVEHNE
mmetsp:Transcript_21525/g.30938  ORF Transcript_21525/g.30938 Transcript_21525/m.30938 type:complete len:88 (+) Transcript_21525:103-366(+)|eukprot:CAMPEP_0202450888 /NCGR_PEP_ID=MMETSP1360-20130828/9421_1 /ASSEMBLY_ACC=CAM_ASM_000848 /TAXON_ID=515479 /ORGANISM="Licmophora paradoxa, Strain CCMP2313" /LENGTH=87 /DNA_ID=CAMNT_0049069301 /DNA_START=103 /DNA_END=366 /DNA_ORIENTATION=-